LESVVELRTGCSVHHLFYQSKKNKMVDETLIDWGLKPLTLALTFNLDGFGFTPSVLGCIPSLENIVVNEINLVQMSLACYVDTWSWELVTQNI